jgi:hypothetical protein
MSATLRTDTVTIVFRQIESADELRLFSTIKSAGGFRFVEETHIHEPSGPGYEDYWYWEKTHESGVYATEQEAFDCGMTILSWPQKSK